MTDPIRAAALEEAARVCDEIAHDASDVSVDFQMGIAHGAMRSANAIRALVSQQQNAARQGSSRKQIPSTEESQGQRPAVAAPASHAMKQVPKDAPVLLAWNNYKSTGEDYANTRKWALDPEHVDGSLWAAFYAGFFACAVNEACDAPASPPSGPTPRWRVRGAGGTDLIDFWKSFAKHSNEYAAAEIVEELERRCRAMATEVRGEEAIRGALQILCNRYEEALRIIAGEQQCADNLMSDKDVARAALSQEGKGDKPMGEIEKATLERRCQALEQALREFLRLRTDFPGFVRDFSIATAKADAALSQREGR